MTPSMLLLLLLLLLFLLALASQTPRGCSLVEAQTVKPRRVLLERQGEGHVKKKHISIATVEVPPFMMKRYSDANDGSFEWYGYCIDFFQELVKHLPYDLTFEIYQVGDNKFGGLTRQIVPVAQNGTNNGFKKVERWTGLIGDLYEGKAQLALAPLAVMAERELAIDFTVPFYDLVGIQILLKKPDVPHDWFKFLTVFDGQVWFSLAVVYFVTSFIMFLFDRLSPYSHKNMSVIRQAKKTRKALEMKKQKEQGNLKLPPVSSEEPPRVKNLQASRVLPNYNSRAQRRPSVFFLSGHDSALDKHQPTNQASNGNSNLKSSKKYSLTPSEQQFKNIKFRNTAREIEGVKPDQVESRTEDSKPDFGLSESFWFCITSLTPQGGGEAPQNLSGRVVAGAWWLFCFIIIASYTANLAAFLTVSRLDLPIESLDDLSKQYQIKYAPVDGSAEQAYFERMAHIEEMLYNIWKEMSLNQSLTKEERSKFAVWDYPISDKYTRIWTQIQQVGMPMDVASGIKKVKNSTLEHGFALLTDANTVRYAVLTDCSLKATGEEFSRKPISLGVQKGEERFRDDLSYAILQLINERFMEILRERWWTNNPQRMVCSNDDESEGIRVENIIGVFIIIFAGVGLAFLVWGIERMVYRIKVGASQDLMRKL